jgi:hypothetical protein
MQKASALPWKPKWLIYLVLLVDTNLASYYSLLIIIFIFEFIYNIVQILIQRRILQTIQKRFQCAFMFVYDVSILC